MKQKADRRGQREGGGLKTGEHSLWMTPFEKAGKGTKLFKCLSKTSKSVKYAMLCA